MRQVRFGFDTFWKACFPLHVVCVAVSGQLVCLRRFQQEAKVLGIVHTKRACEPFQTRCKGAAAVPSLCADAQALLAC